MKKCLPAAMNALFIGAMLIGGLSMQGSAETSAISKEDSTAAAVSASEEETEESSDTEKSEEEVYGLGDTVETNIVRFTLVNAEYAIRVNNTRTGEYDEPFFTAAEYNAEEDAGKAFIANVGHTYVAMEFRLENLDRASIFLNNSANISRSEFFFRISADYDGETYVGGVDGEREYGASSEDGHNWKNYFIGNIGLSAGEVEYIRCYIDIPVDVKDLDDDVDLTFTIPNSDGESTEFVYHVSAEDRAKAQEETESESAAAEETVYTDAETVEKVQTALNEAGYDCGTPDGIAGKATYAAMNAYQEDNGLPVSNSITDSLLVSLGIQ